MKILNVTDDKKTGRLYWGNMPLPYGTILIGLIRTEVNDKAFSGALLRQANGRFVQGNAGIMYNLDQAEIKAILKRL